MITLQFNLDSEYSTLLSILILVTTLPANVIIYKL